MAGLFDKANDFLKSDKGEQVSDDVLDRAAKIADERTGGKHSEQIAKGREEADRRIGNE